MSTLEDLYQLRKKRLSLQREADLLEQEEKKLATGVVNEWVANGTTEEDIGAVTVSLKSSSEPVAHDWPALLTYIINNNAVDILQKRITPTAVKARWNDGEEVPGIHPETKYTLKFD
jgi:hypothetical protein